MRWNRIAITIFAALSAVHFAFGQDALPKPVDAGVAWYSDWDVALAEAKRSQRPILLQFARPACRGVSGVF